MKASVYLASFFIVLPIISCQQMSKMLVAIGDNGPFDENTRKSEVIDLLDPAKKCEQLPEFPFLTADGAGGLLTGSEGPKPLVCAGLFSQDCHLISDGNNEVAASLLTSRFTVSSIVVDNKHWITGIKNCLFCILISTM